jgi:hypothetical protein
VIALYVNFSPVFSQAIEKPSIAEAFSLVPRQEFTELSNSSLQPRKFFFQDFLNDYSVSGPIRRDRVEPFQLGQNFTPESYRRLVESGLTVSAISDIADKNRTQNSTNNFLKVIHEKFKHRPETPFDWFWWIVIFPIMLMPLWITWIFPNIYSYYSGSDNGHKVDPHGF